MLLRLAQVPPSSGSYAACVGSRRAADIHHKHGGVAMAHYQGAKQEASVRHAGEDAEGVGLLMTAICVGEAIARRVRQGGRLLSNETYQSDRPTWRQKEAEKGKGGLKCST